MRSLTLSSLIFLVFLVSSHLLHFNWRKIRFILPWLACSIITWPSRRIFTKCMILNFLFKFRKMYWRLISGQPFVHPLNYARIWKYPSLLYSSKWIIWSKYPYFALIVGMVYAFFVLKIENCTAAFFNYGDVGYSISKFFIISNIKRQGVFVRFLNILLCSGTRKRTHFN